MRIKEVETTGSNCGFRIVCQLELGAVSRALFFEVEGSVMPPSPEMAGAACLAAALPVSAWLAEDLEIQRACDREFLQRAELLARAYRRLHGLNRDISVTGEGVATGAAPNRHASCSFSGGVDSMFSVKRHLDPEGLYPISSLTTIFGVDIPHTEREAHEKVRTRLSAFSESIGLAHIFVRTNFREVFDDVAPWGRITHGACVASVGFVLSGSVETYLLPSSSVIDRVYAWGSHPMIDNSFVSSHTRIVNDNWEFYRNEKIRFLAEDPMVLKHLKVCNKKDRVSNCGKCEKCLRTMAMLMVLGKLDQANCFPEKLTLQQLRDHKIRNKKEIYRFEQLRIEAEKESQSEVVSAVSTVLQRGRVRLMRRRVLASLKLHRTGS